MSPGRDVNLTPCEYEANNCSTPIWTSNYLLVHTELHLSMWRLNEAFSLQFVELSHVGYPVVFIYYKVGLKHHKHNCLFCFIRRVMWLQVSTTQWSS
jgi:hypothetical protein